MLSEKKQKKAAGGYVHRMPYQERLTAWKRAINYLIDR